MKNCNCIIVENHEYGGDNSMNFLDLKEFIKGDLKFLDGRRCLLTMYNYCPYCGKKIDWKKIKKLISNK